MKILAIDIGGTAIKYGIVREDFSIEQSFEIPTEAYLGGPHLMNKIMTIVGEYANDVACVGISTAGQVNSELGKIIFASENIPNYTGIEITKTIHKNITCLSAWKMTSIPPPPRRQTSVRGAGTVISFA